MPAPARDLSSPVTSEKLRKTLYLIRFFCKFIFIFKRRSFFFLIIFSVRLIFGRKSYLFLRWEPLPTSLGGSHRILDVLSLNKLTFSYCETRLCLHKTTFTLGISGSIEALHVSREVTVRLTSLVAVRIKLIVFGGTCHLNVVKRATNPRRRIFETTSLLNRTIIR